VCGDNSTAIHDVGLAIEDGGLAAGEGFDARQNAELDRRPAFAPIIVILSTRGEK
jgi:hypothetical protein